MRNEKKKSIWELKNILLILVVLFTIGITPAMAAETIIYSEGFESNDGGYTHTGTLDQWQWGTPTYALGPASANSGTKVWGTNLAGEVPLNSDSSLTSPKITIPALGPNEIARVRFFAWIAVDYMNDRGEFMVSKDGTTWETKAELLYKMSGDWGEYYFDVSDYAGGDIYLRFRLRTDNSDYRFYPDMSARNMAGLYIDDIALILMESPVVKTKLTLEAWEDPAAYASCPWVYTWDGSDYIKDNDIYSTARGAGSEYTDYYKLNKQPVESNGKYQLRLIETQDESSYTDMVKLITVDHPADVKISNDENGNIWTYSSPSAPASATDKNGNSVLSQISSEDNTGTKVYQDDIIDLDFGGSDTSNGATLVLHVLGFQMEADPGAPTNEKPYIYIQTKEGGNWVTRNIFYPRSDWATNAYNLAPYLTESKLVRLLVKSCNVGKYHIIDYVGLDTSGQGSTTINVLSPVTAVNSVNGDVLGAISTSDNNYASMSPAETISLEFSAPAATDLVRDFIFVSEGYYLPMGTFFIYTWDGSKWAQRDGWSIESGYGIDDTRDFDLSLWLPDPSGEYKVRIWQDYWYESAGIDYVGLTQGSTAGTMSYAWDLKKSQDVQLRLQASDNSKDEWTSSSIGKRDRWVEVRWTGLGSNIPPTTNPVAVTNPTSSTPTIGWTYNDANGDPQAQYEVQVWTGPGGTGTNEWNPAVGSGTGASVVYAGDPLVDGQTYYARVRAFDGTNWGGWSEASWTYTPSQQPQCSDGIDNDGDGLIDYGSSPGNDPGCSSLQDNDERDSNSIPEFPSVALPVISVVSLMFLLHSRKK
ncbi:Uncharacterised protein [uncultured archaeon]|nr:Uncharacterised protein [uncultured archaeon]